MKRFRLHVLLSLNIIFNAVTAQVPTIHETIDESGKEPVVVIGEGIKKEWLSKPMSVEGMHIQGNVLDWKWDGNSLNVRLHGAKLKVRAGTPFEKNTDLKLRYN